MRANARLLAAAPAVHAHLLPSPSFPPASVGMGLHVQVGPVLNWDRVYGPEQGPEHQFPHL